MVIASEGLANAAILHDDERGTIRLCPGFVRTAAKKRDASLEEIAACRYDHRAGIGSQCVQYSKKHAPSGRSRQRVRDFREDLLRCDQ